MRQAGARGKGREGTLDKVDGGSEHLSYWIAASGPGTRYPAQEGEVRTDVAVLGGGIVGLTVAALLKRAGKRVAVVEMSQVGTGVTGHSTAKITSQPRAGPTPRRTRRRLRGSRASWRSPA